MTEANDDIDIHAKHASLDQSITDLRGVVSDLAKGQKDQWEKINSISASVSEIATSLKSNQGKIDLRTLVTVLGLVFGVVGSWSALVVSPISTKVDANAAAENNRYVELTGQFNRTADTLEKSTATLADAQAERTEQLTTVIGEVKGLDAKVSSIFENGSSGTRERLTRLELTVDEDHAARMAQLETEAKAWRDSGRAKP